MPMLLSIIFVGKNAAKCHFRGSNPWVVKRHFAGHADPTSDITCPSEPGPSGGMGSRVFEISRQVESGRSGRVGSGQVALKYHGSDRVRSGGY